jgi:aryl-alcohol dehydrogenase-like predicted oxidoreductase
MTRTLGRTGLAVSPLSLAGMYGAGPDAVERGFHEHGVNTFFVSTLGGGVTEGVRRLVKAGHREKLTIIAGVSLPFGWLVRLQVERLRRVMGVDALDAALLLWVRSRWAMGGRTWPALQRLRGQGAVRYLGISCHDRPLARALADEYDLDVLMLRYNAAHRGAERDVFATLPRRRPGIIAYTATRWGQLLREMTPGECYRFALTDPHVDTVLTGASGTAQLAENAMAVREGPLTEPRLGEVRAFGDRVRAASWLRM